ncbi:hypothetical protein C8Q75DRAFT_770457, partial [Abortiporus biennis]
MAQVQPEIRTTLVRQQFQNPLIIAILVQAIEADSTFKLGLRGSRVSLILKQILYEQFMFSIVESKDYSHCTV